MKLANGRQIQFIADLCSGQDSSIGSFEDLDSPYSEYFLWIIHWQSQNQTATRADLLNAFYAEFITNTRSMADREINIQNSHLIHQAIQHPLHYPSAAEFLPTVPDLKWLWQDWLPIGLVSLLAAVPGTGKSYFALDLAYRIVTNQPFPDGTPIPDPDGQNYILYVDAENTPVIFKKRTEVWQPGDLSHVYLMLPDKDRFVINLDDAAERDRLWDMTWIIKPRLLILDSYGCATLRGENNKEDVQQLLAFLNRLAKDFDMALLIVHHLRKKSGPQTSFLPMTLDSIRGSSHIPAMARNVLGLQWIPTTNSLDENGPRRLWVMKSNLTRYPEPIGVFFDPHPQNPDVALIRYGEAPQPYQEMTKGDYCGEWLEDLLKNTDEPMKPKEIFELGKEEGYNKRMISRIRQRLKHIQDTEQDPYHPDNEWKWTSNHDTMTP